MKIPHNFEEKKMYNNDDIMQEIRELRKDNSALMRGTQEAEEKLLTRIQGLVDQNQMLVNALEKITIRLNRLERDKEINKQEGYVEADDLENA